MKGLIFGSLSVMLLASMSTPAVRAEIPRENAYNYPAQDTPSFNSQITPFNLVGLAYQGFLKNQGIPSGGILINLYQNREITGKDLVESAVKANRLSPEVLNDSGYIADVDNQLDWLHEANNGASIR
jgi:hypothetical protein